ncbi:hypothetical protein GT037_005921 [Alternaria burnsii]|uniref:Uncharacterized protein n=1 Tax=Alternaria burnsii TaxID=1187904 RepID=A0A8H7EHZ3_9PLEO|nr:uncharacterized protein GT037_005921 [Alternaria burnsii]KAF7676416.1 hypothetical protein GT037_005921 [Alternaria burnsii]
MVVTRRDGVENRAAASGPAPPTVQAGRMREQARPSLQAKRDQTGKPRLPRHPRRPTPIMNRANSGTVDACVQGKEYDGKDGANHSVRRVWPAA